jgi:pimeloyl-ACP methyl ester carboxylesterase/DNA-binding CsgD family transcriptional regulator
MAYVLDPTQWRSLMSELEDLGETVQQWGAGELLAQLSRAETLSWRIKHDGGGFASAGFAYLLLDEHDRATGLSDNLPQLAEYLRVSSRSQRLVFQSEMSRVSYEEAKKRLHASPRGHILVELSHPTRSRHRYGYLVAENEFPNALKSIANGARRALLIANDQPSNKLKNVLRGSFGLTAAETEIMLKIAGGMTLKQTAGDLHISVNTARNHLQAIFDKSGINRQGELVLVVTQLSIVLAATGADAPEELSRPPGENSAPFQHFMILEDGRRIAYRTYGDSMGEPVVYLHETLGSSRLPPGTDDAARERGLYLIAWERPGCGFSDPNAGFTFDSVAQDLCALLDHLRVPDCQLLGFLSGAAYAIVFANTCPDRVARLFLVAGRPPAPLTGRFSFLMTLRTKMMKQPWLLSTFFNILRNRSSLETNGRLIRGIYGAVPYDQAFLDRRPDIFQHMIQYTVESLTTSASGIIHELQCFENAPEYNLESLTAPVLAWHGTADHLSSLDDLAAFLGDKLKEVRKFEDAGSLILLEHWESVLDELKSYSTS